MRGRAGRRRKMADRFSRFNEDRDFQVTAAPQGDRPRPLYPGSPVAPSGRGGLLPRWGFVRRPDSRWRRGATQRRERGGGRGGLSR